jgi:ADP-heptose:LPS heptosyltransferase
VSRNSKQERERYRSNEVLRLPSWSTKTLAAIASKLYGGKDINQPFSLGRIAQSARRVLVVPPAGLAEMLLMYPALSLLRTALPDSRIICLVDDGQAELLRDDGIVDDTIVFPRFRGAKGMFQYRSFISEIRERMFEAVFYFDFRYEFYRVLLPGVCGARLRVKLKDDVGYPLFNVEVVPNPDSTYFKDLNLCLVRFLAPDVDMWRNWRLPDKESKIAKEIVKFRKPRSGDLLVGVDLSFTKGGGRPPFETQIRLARSFQALKPCRIALLSDPEPAVKDEEIRRLGNYDWLDIPRKNFRDTLGILSQCDLLITGNSNLLHFALTMEIPSYVLFSREEDMRWRPTQGVFQVIGEDVWTGTPPAKLAMQMRDFACAPSGI